MQLKQSFVLDFVERTTVDLQVVDGDTANVFEITLKTRGAMFAMNPANLYKVIAVFERADGRIYTQDASTGVSFTTAGVVTINVHPASFRTGRNSLKLQVYARASAGDTEYPDLLTTREAVFMARSAALDDDAPNAPSQLPMLEELIAEARAYLPITLNLDGIHSLNPYKYEADMSDADKAAVQALVNAYIANSGDEHSTSDLYRLRVMYPDPFVADAIVVTGLSWAQIEDYADYALLFGVDAAHGESPYVRITNSGGELSIMIWTNA